MNTPDFSKISCDVYNLTNVIRCKDYKFWSVVDNKVLFHTSVSAARKRAMEGKKYGTYGRLNREKFLEELESKGAENVQKES